MEYTESKVKIYETTDYGAFKKMLGNRDVRGEAKIVDSISAVGLVCNPIIVNESMEVIDGRMGALMQRLDSCKRRLIAYANGEIAKIEELEAEILPLGFIDTAPGEIICYNCYGRISTANQYTHAM